MVVKLGDIMTNLIKSISSAPTCVGCGNQIKTKRSLVKIKTSWASWSKLDIRDGHCFYHRGCLKNESLV